MSDAICAGADPVPSASQVPPQNAAKTDSQSLEEPQEVPTSQETSSDPSEDSTSLSEAGHVEAMHDDTDSQEDAEGGVSLSEGRTEIHNYMHKHYHVHNDTFMFRTEKHNHQRHEHHHHYHWHFHSQSWQPQANNGHPEMLPGVGPQPQPPNTSPERQDQDAQTRSQALVRSDGQHEGGVWGRIAAESAHQAAQNECFLSSGSRMKPILLAWEWLRAATTLWYALTRCKNAIELQFVTNGSIGAGAVGACG